MRKLWRKVKAEAATVLTAKIQIESIKAAPFKGSGRYSRMFCDDHMVSVVLLGSGMALNYTYI